METVPSRGRLARAAIAVLVLAACAEGGDQVSANDRPLTVREIATPAGPSSGEPNLTTGPDGAYLSWLEATTPERHALRLARWDGERWTEPVTVIDRSDLFVNWADFPSVLVLDDGTLAAHWLEKSGPGAYAYDVRMAISADDGRTWSEDVIPHRDGVQTEHGFVSLFPLDGRIGAVWLDGRGMPDGEPMALRFTTVDRAANAGEEILLDSSVCDCCQTSAAVAADGPVVAYRDRTADEVRDIYVARRVDGEWRQGVPVHRDGWVIPGCPVNGPAIDADGRRVAVAWFTAAGDADDVESRQDIRRLGENGRVLVAFSEDGGASFGTPVRVDGHVAMGRVDLALTPDGDAVVAWLERVDGAAEVRIRRVRPGGAGPATTVAGTAAERASGFPRITRLGREIMVAWTDAGDPSTVRMAVARLGGVDRRGAEDVATGSSP